MIAEAPYLFAVAALSVSLAGFAGLVAAFRRGAELRPLDFFRLRQIAEFGFANAVIALLPIPLVATLGELPTAVRVTSAVAFLYAVAYAYFLLRRGLGLGLTYRSDPIVVVVLLNVGILATALIATTTAAIAALEWLLLILLARPMMAFVLVLQSLRGSP